MADYIRDVPVVPLKGLVVFPGISPTLHIVSKRSVTAIDMAIDKDKQVLLVAKIDPNREDPGPGDIFRVGVLASILQVRPRDDGGVEVTFSSEQRAEIVEANVVSVVADKMPEVKANRRRCLLVDAEPMIEVLVPQEDVPGLLRDLVEGFEAFANRSKQISPEILKNLMGINDLGELTDSIASHIPIKLQDKQKILELAHVGKRAVHLARLLHVAVNSALQVDTAVKSRVKKQMDKSQREYLLNEQMKAIQRELGQLEDGPDEIAELEQRFLSTKMSKEALKKGAQELKKLKTMPPMAAEASVVRSYIDWLIALPWSKRTRSHLDLAEAERVLEQDHYGLAEVKDRILEYLAVHKRVKNIKGSVLCLVGPPGVGKTSLGASIAKAMNLKFTRVALGGVRDEAEIRGHRRTYIGSMPGKILQKLAKVGVCNPLFLLDEIDKMGSDAVRGDPAAALLEVLDSEQNNTFNDHYLEIDYDLSRVLFVCTSNSMNIPPALRDRLEIIQLPGYTEDEKFNIAKRHLLPKQLSDNGLRKGELEVEDDALLELIRHYTKEAGVRGLEREIAKLCRKIVRERDKKKTNQKKSVVTAECLERYSGVKKYRHGQTTEKSRVGHALGLAWTEVGGELLDIEASAVPGQGKRQSTGRLGDIMQESIAAASTYIRGRSDVFNLPKDFYKIHDIHVHVPEGATPKDGPSAGIGMCVAMVSSLTGIAVRHDVAMTGEITLRGQILPVGGLKEKLLAAARGGVKTVLIPEENTQDIKEVPDNIKAGLDIKTVSWMDEALKIALVEAPETVQGSSYRAKEGTRGDTSDSNRGTVLDSH